MAPVKPVNGSDKQVKKKRTFFASKLAIPIPPASATEKGKQKAVVVSTKTVLSALDGLESVSRSTPISNGNRRDQEKRPTATHTPSRAQTVTSKLVQDPKIYTRRNKPKVQATITRSSEVGGNVKNGVDGKIKVKSEPSSSVSASSSRLVNRKKDVINDTGRVASAIEPQSSSSSSFVVGKHKHLNVKTKTKSNSKVGPSAKAKIITIKSSSSRRIPHTTLKSSSKTKSAKTTTRSSGSAKTSNKATQVRAILSRRIIRTYEAKSQTKSEPSQIKGGISSGSPEKQEKGKEKEKEGKPLKKDYMSAGFYCQDPHPSSSKQLHNKILAIRSAENKASKLLDAKAKAKAKATPTIVRQTRNNVKSHSSESQSASASTSTYTSTAQSSKKSVDQERPSFPPLPYDHGYDLFFKQEHEFVLPYHIMKEKEDGKLVAKKKPTQFTKIRGNIYPERPKVMTDFHAICKCSPESKCADQCINKLMSYLCGKECPAGDECTNKTLTKRKAAAYKVADTGTRGFGIILLEDVKEGDFVMDYRGEVISIDLFMDRIQDEYKGTKNFYALAYDQDEVIDAGMKGNDARFINHGCAPNLEVRKYQTAGDGWDEFEVGMWAIKDIKAGEELFYDYNFESFGVAAQSDELRTKCHCGAPNCVGFLGRKAGEKSAKELAAELARNAKILQGKKASIKKLKSKLAEKAQAESRNAAKLGTTVLGLEDTPSIISNADTITTTSIKTPSQISPSRPQINARMPSSSPLSELDPVEAESQTKGLPKDKKRKNEILATTEAETKKKRRKSEPLPIPKKATSKPRKSEPSATSASTLNSAVRIKSVGKKARKSEPIPTSTVKRDEDESEDEAEKKPFNNPRICMDAVREAARIKKAEVVKARRGAPKGWTIVLPGHEPPPRAAPLVVSTRKPPRDRSSLG
ncbi:uncharacterized protein I303_101591 [Kwoniella dejecticola CBS 10117]|uniref:Histone-lysine N-methyltransferase ASH1L n=1 Tax=Kwoniella dejecticola CBS 10117 TaxID=1296121 RepID=A0A1A6ADB4_9TREE|nr:uncharacterized protein I303_02275 [Kwoniella dejecticola CBS 10117]OBR88057.1 hypothetical protein I303_02275 [Kwoniella dejecticola CBS 10117]